MAAHIAGTASQMAIARAARLVRKEWRFQNAAATQPTLCITRPLLLRVSLSFVGLRGTLRAYISADQWNFHDPPGAFLQQPETA